MRIFLDGKQLFRFLMSCNYKNKNLFPRFKDYDIAVEDY